MNIAYNPKKEQGLIEDMGNALNFMLEFCGYPEKCRECVFENACYNLSKLADEFVSIGDGENGSKR